MDKRIIIVALLVLTAGVFMITCNHWGWPYHFINLLRKPSDLYAPIVEDSAFPKQKGETKTYNLNPKYSEIYSIGFDFKGQGIKTDFKFTGKYKLEFYDKNHFKVYEQIASSVVNSLYAKGSMTYFSKINIAEFTLPIKGCSKKNCELKITALEPDSVINVMQPSPNLVVMVSETP